MSKTPDIPAIRAREAAATPGPWVPFDSDPLCPFPAAIEYQRSFKISTPDDEDPRSAGMDPDDMNLPIATVDRYEKSDQEAYANRDFICGARMDIPTLLDAYDAVVADNTRLRAGINELRREHWMEEGDCWYSCPKSGDSCNDENPDHCTCGADSHNALVDALLSNGGNNGG